MMQGFPAWETSPAQTGSQRLAMPLIRKHTQGTLLWHGSELAELLDQGEGAIRDFSEELVHQLARRDELEFEKEVKNSFITVLTEVQNKQKEQRELAKKRWKEKGLSLQSSGIEKGNQMPLKQYLNTVIPYEKKSSPPSVEDLQMLTNRRKLSEDNEKVPTLLTDCILKVLRPT
uniref:Uncharacterized protein n=1 Tax=Peromyscus maniculatus bairdii TaxID=230844 RepID=A0A8C8UBE6_PERMB